jgi:tRNA A-37 threonylcarbamoyl transferase component Bud32
MHLENFMLSDDEIFSLDGAGVKFYQNGVDREVSLDNLAMFLAQLAPEWESMVPEVYNLYAAERDWQQGLGEKLLLDKVHRAREVRWKEFRKKLFRNCTAFSYTEHGDGFQVVANRYGGSELFELLRNPDSSFPGSEHAIKNGNTCTVWATKAGGLELVIKRYNIKDIWHGLKLRLLSGRGEHSWVNGHRLLFYGVATPNPVALLKRRFGLFPATYLFTERVDAVSSKEWFSDRKISIDAKQGVANMVAGMFKTMRQQNISHGDLKASNILICDNKPVIIDLDAMRRHKSDSSFRKAWSKDMRRFMQNWEDDKELLGIFSNALKTNGVDAAGAF